MPSIPPLTSPGDQRFEEVKNYIHSLVNEFQEKYGLDPDEVESAAHYGFVQAFHSYDGSTEFITWVGYKVQKRLKDVLRNKLEKKTLVTVPLDLTEYDIADEQPEFQLDEWLETLSADAQKVAVLALKCPIDIKLILKQIGGEDSPGNYRQAIREFLIESEWEKSRIQKSFSEIQERL